jgi:hypothetical protein
MKTDGVSATHNHRDQEHVGVVPARRTRPSPRWRRYGGSLVLVLTLALLSCGGGDHDLSGTWAGTVQDNLAGTGTVLFTFSQAGSTLSGNWQLTFPTGNNGGTLSGTVSDDSISMLLSSTQSQGCSFTVAAQRDGDDHFTGTYTSTSSCAVLENGTLDVRRQ